MSLGVRFHENLVAAMRSFADDERANNSDMPSCRR